MPPLVFGGVVVVSVIWLPVGEIEGAVVLFVVGMTVDSLLEGLTVDRMGVFEV